MLFVKTHNSGMATHCFRKREREIQNSQNMYNSYIRERTGLRFESSRFWVVRILHIIFHDCHFLEVFSVTTGGGGGGGGEFSTFYSVANFQVREPSRQAKR